MGMIDPGEGFRLLLKGEPIREDVSYYVKGKWRKMSTDTNVGEPWNDVDFFPMRVPKEIADNTGIEVFTGGPYVAIEVHRAALAEIEVLTLAKQAIAVERYAAEQEVKRLKAELDAIKQPQQKPSETPQAGQYWVHDKSGDRAYFIGKCPDDIMVWQIEGDNIEHGNLDWSGWHHEPRCTGWDWQPDPEPEWFDLTPFGEHVWRSCDEAFLPSRGQWLSVYMANAVGASISEMRRVGYTQFRCLLRDAPPELVAKAKESQCIHTFDCGSGDHSDACPASVPQQPKTETVVFHEVIVWRDGTRKLEWIECPSEGCIGTGKTETREVTRG